MLKAANQVKCILDLIITLERLGLDNHYEDEISELLSFVHSSDYDDKDLYLVSLRFYLLRKHGYYVSSGNQLTHLLFIKLFGCAWLVSSAQCRSTTVTLSIGVNSICRG